MSNAFHILDLPIKHELADDDSSSFSTENNEANGDPLTFVVLKEIKPLLKEHAQRLGKVERESRANGDKAIKAVAAIEIIVNDFENLKLRMNVAEAAIRTPWNRKDDDGQGEFTPIAISGLCLYM